MEDITFALDIGTRSVTGILLKKENDYYKLLDYVMMEHKDRAMRDGQIHHVVAVAEIIKEVKEKLEQRNNFSLQKVCVAAAGRALKTIEAEATVALEQQPLIDDERVKHLELSAVQSAQEKLIEQQKDQKYTNYYCVGYSVMHYKLDGEPIGYLIDQSGEVASVEIIATFLPKVVVDSLLAALTRAELEMEALTLEPIAAIQVLVPSSMRRLNVVLVDIGAGTSDIAITNGGTVVAYGMVPVAGDEITEAVSDQYLLDFHQAERTKRLIVNDKKAKVNDILGFETEISYQTFVQDIKNNIVELASSIAAEISRLNNGAPRAVMLIGGGSLTPELPKILAEKLELPANRVAVRGMEAIQPLIQDEHTPKGPDFITPVGIAIASKQNPVHYITVTVNGKRIRLFELKQLTIGDCLIQAGVNIKKWYGKPGMASIVTVNGKEVTIPGELGETPTITRNHRPASVNDLISNGDEITVERGKDGKSAKLSLKELIGEVSPTIIFFENKSYTLDALIEVNGEKKDDHYIVKDKDEIVIKQIKTVKDFIKQYLQMDVLESFVIYLNGKQVKLECGETRVMLNGKQSYLNERLKQNDRLIVETIDKPRVKDMLNQIKQNYWHSIRVFFNGKPVEMKQARFEIIKNDENLSEDDVLELNDQITMKELPNESAIFQDIFRYVEIDITRKSGKFHLYKNKQIASFHTPIMDGDELEIVWDDE